MFGKLLNAKPVSEDLEVIKLEFLMSAFGLLVFGIVISTIAFVCEILHYMIKNKRG